MCSIYSHCRTPNQFTSTVTHWSTVTDNTHVYFNSSTYSQYRNLNQPTSTVLAEKITQIVHKRYLSSWNGKISAVPLVLLHPYPIMSLSLSLSNCHQASRFNIRTSRTRNHNAISRKTPCFRCTSEAKVSDIHQNIEIEGIKTKILTVAALTDRGQRMNKLIASTYQVLGNNGETVKCLSLFWGIEARTVLTAIGVDNTDLTYFKISQRRSAMLFSVVALE